jgi:hypothetical protein
MLVKILGAIDVLAGLILVFASLNFPKVVLVIFGILLLAKSLLGMLKEFGSWIDFSCGVVLLLLLVIDIHPIISLVLGILIFQKGFFSFL